MWAVDTACLLPMRVFPKPFEMAWAFRNKTPAMRADHLRSMPYQESVPDWAAYYQQLPGALPPALP